MYTHFSKLNKKRRKFLYENSNSVYYLKNAESIEVPVPIESFEIVNQVGKGTYGSVDMANSPSKQKVAVKRLLLENEQSGTGFPITALREIKILSSLDHKNIVQLLDVVTSSEQNSSKKEVFLVFEYLDHDLSGLMKNPQVKFTESNIKFYVLGLFEALYYLHEKCKVLHRDVKGSNVLIGNDGAVKLGDFGLSRQLKPRALCSYTRRVVTLWYRAPELLFGQSEYTSSIDIWSAGCVLAEFFLGKPLFPGNSEAEQIDRICSLVGSPSDKNYPEALEEFEITTMKMYPRDFSKLFFIKKNCPLGFDLLTKILVLDPKKRLTAAQVLEHDFIHSKVPSLPLDLEKVDPSHEFETQERRRESYKRKRNNKKTLLTDSENFSSDNNENIIQTKKPQNNLNYMENNKKSEEDSFNETSTEISSSEGEVFQSGSEDGEILG